MKKSIVLITIAILFLFTGNMQAQNLTFNQLKYFEDNKLDKANCLFWWFFTHGGGAFYSKSDGDGIFFMTAEIVGTFLLINNYDNKSFRNICLIALPLIKFGELFISFGNIRAYNRDLLDKIQRNMISDLNLKIKMPI